MVNRLITLLSRIFVFNSNKLFFRSSQTLFLALIASLAFPRNFAVVVGGSFVVLTDYLFVAAFVVWAAAILCGQASIRRAHFYWPLAFYAAALILSVVFSVERHTIKLIGEIYLITLAFLAFNLTEDLIFLRKVVLTWTAATLAAVSISVIAIVCFYTNLSDVAPNWYSYHGTLPPGNFPRVQAAFFNPNMFCNYLNVGVLLFFAARRLRWLNRIFDIIFTILLVPAVLFTLSPGIGGVLLSVGLWFYFVKRDSARTTANLSIIGGGTAAILFFLIVLISPIVTKTAPYSFDLPLLGTVEPSIRVLAWTSALQNFAQHPLLGVGVGVDTAAAHYLDASGNWQTLRDAHQIWLNVAAQSGLIGLAAFLGLTIFLFKQAFRPHSAQPEIKLIGAAMGIALIGALGHQGLNGSYEDARHLWVLFGLIAAIGRNFD